MAKFEMFSINVTAKTPSGQIISKPITSIKASSESAAKSEAKERAMRGWSGNNKIISAIITSRRPL